MALLKAWNAGEFADIKAAKRERLGGGKRPAEAKAKTEPKAKAKQPKTKAQAAKPKAKAETEPKAKAEQQQKKPHASTRAEKPLLMSDSDWDGAGINTESGESDNVPEMCEDPVLLSGLMPEADDEE